MSAFKPATDTTTTSTAMTGSKVTRHEIEARMTAAAATAAAAAAAATTTSVVVVDDVPIEENVNRMMVDGLEARTVDEAIKLLRYLVVVLLAVVVVVVVAVGAAAVGW